MMAWCDNTSESLALKLRAGNAGSNTVADHIEVLDEAIAQVPARYRRDLLITVDGAAASHGLVDHISVLGSRPGHRVHYSIGWELGGRERTAIDRVPTGAWAAVLDGPLTSAEPKTLRYRLLHTAARIVRGQRKRKIRIPETWPWARQLAACLATALTLPPPT